MSRSSEKSKTNPLARAFFDAYTEDDWETVKELATKDPSVLHLRYMHSDTVLHDLLRRISPDPNEAIQLLMRLNGAAARDTVGFLAESEEFIMENYGFGTQHTLLGGGPTPDGLLPIHLAAMNRDITLETFKLISQSFPEGITRVDSQGNNPLHYVIKYLENSGDKDLKISYLLDENDTVADAENADGDFALHLAVRSDLILYSVAAIYSRHPEAAFHRNKQGKLPLDLALKNMPTSKDICEFLVRAHNPYPGKNLWIDFPKSSFWVSQNYSKTWVNRRLQLPIDYYQYEDEDSEEDANENSSPAESSSTCSLQSNTEVKDDGIDDYNDLPKEKETAQESPATDTVQADGGPALKKAKVCATSPVVPSTYETFVAEEAVKLSLDWLSPSKDGWLSSVKDLLAVSAVSKELLLKVSKLKEPWDTNLKCLDKSLGLQKQNVAESEFFPAREFVDPRLCPEYKDLTPFKKCMYLGQYKSMVLNYLRAPMDEDAEAFMKDLLCKIRSTVREADKHGYFDPDINGEDAMSEKPANVHESLARCTLDKLKKHIVGKTVEGFLRDGISRGWAYSAITVGWDDINIGAQDDLTYVFLCNEIAGLGIIMGRHGCRSF